MASVAETLALDLVGMLPAVSFFIRDLGTVHLSGEMVKIAASQLGQTWSLESFRANVLRRLHLKLILQVYQNTLSGLILLHCEICYSYKRGTTESIVYYLQCMQFESRYCPLTQHRAKVVLNSLHLIVVLMAHLSRLVQCRMCML